jgi:hypothetical protein
LLLCVAGTTWAQVVYEPVRYQFGRGGGMYYYGGCDPRVHERAAYPAGVTFGRINGFAFVSGNVQTHRAVVTEPTRVFSDAMPLRNARFFGATPDDAGNEALSNMPRFFRKSDLIATGVRQTDGTLSVPSMRSEDRPTTEAEKRIIIRPFVGRPLHEPRPLIVIPRGGVDGPLNSPVKPDGQPKA